MRETLLWVIKRQIQKGIHSSTRTIYEWYQVATDTWTEERLDADTFTNYEVDAVLDLVKRDGWRNSRVLCTMKQAA